jgi:hypothetical protein
MIDQRKDRFQKNFIWNNESYGIDVIPFHQASENDKTIYLLVEGSFLVTLTHRSSKNTFSVFINDNLEWDSNVSKIILDDKNLIEKIGHSIDDYYA